MDLKPGRKLLHYELVEKIGEGGMGVVWKALDTTLDRQVAIKILPDPVSDDAARLERFEREAKLLASLNHPNIATVHGIHHADGVRFLAMELVDGEDLSQRLQRGPMPVDDALKVAVEIATALDAAHAQGIVHRDLKPANVVITPEDKIKVLDFGLAKALEPGGVVSGDSSLSPTLTSAGTVAGVILGTASYMSPEQARGKPVDKRCDIWAFGCVLYELLSGRQVYAGETVTDTISQLLQLEPEWDALPDATPEAVRRLLRRCLHKHPRRRLHDIADARIEIEEADRESVTSVARAAPSRGWTWLLAGAIAGLALGAMIGPALFRGPTSAGVGHRRPVRSVLPVEPGMAMAFTRILAVSPDGSKVVYAAGDWANPSLRVRRLDSLTDEPIPGTEGGIAPFFSPDGEWVAFFDSDELKKVRLPGGDVVALCEAHVATSGTWADNGWIYFTHGESRLARVRDDGGQPEELPYEVFGPHALPGDRGVLVTQVLPDEPSVRKDTAPIALLSHDGQITRLIDGGYAPSYVQSGHLVFMRGSALLAVPFDLDGLRIDASPVTVVQDIWTDSIWALGQYAVSPGGTLVYIPGSDYARTVPTWIDRQGAETPLSLPADVYNTFQLSPDRRKLAIQVTGSQDQIHVHDLARDTFTRLTLEGSNSYPAWSRDGEQIYFASMRQGKQRMFRRRVDGSGDAEPVLTDEQSAMIRGPFRYPYGESPDGRFLVFASWGDSEQGGDVWALPLDGASDPQALVATRANEIIPEVSPDGKWILYLSNKTGDYETYVRPFPDVAEREWQVSDGGGFDARWSPAGDEILYRKGSMQFWSVRYTTNPDFTPGTPELLFESDAHDSAGFSFDVSADGERMLINKPAISLRNTPPVTLVTNWDSELEGLVPTGP